MKDINEEVLKTFERLKSDPLSLTGDRKYDSFHAYIEGYVDGLNMALKYNLRSEITSFFEAKGNIKTNYYWTNQIKHRNGGKTNIELVEILLDTTAEYFLKNSNWSKEIDQSKIKKDLPVRFNALKNWPYMFIELGLSVPVYLEAFVDGLNVYSSKDLRLEISRWFCQRNQQEESFNWAMQINDYYLGQTEDIVKKLIEITEEYFKSKIIF